jgi:hypothetical protein
VVLFSSDSAPIAELFQPVVFLERLKAPKAILLYPLVFKDKESFQIPILYHCVMVKLPAFVQRNIFGVNDEAV